jgi:lysophospholipase L1-like esterase
VFYDQNADGLQEGNETAVVPGVEVRILARVATAAPGTGRATLTGVPEGTWSAQLQPASLPPFYQAGPAVQVVVPVTDGQPVRLPARLPIGANHPNVYMAVGDSITDGDGSTDETGYRRRLQEKLQAHFGQATIVNRAIGGIRSSTGAALIHASLARVDPAYTLILYGTNDWNDSSCRSQFPCFTIDSLRNIVRATKGAGSLPVLSTIIPVNTGFDARSPESRNVWVAEMNDLVRPMAGEEGALLVDNHKAFLAVPDFHTLFSDHVHPNDAGYAIMADTFFKAISEPAAAEPSSLSMPELLAPPRGAFPESVPDDPADVPRPPRWSDATGRPR